MVRKTCRNPPHILMAEVLVLHITHMTSPEWNWEMCKLSNRFFLMHIPPPCPGRTELPLTPAGWQEENEHLLRLLRVLDHKSDLIALRSLWF